MSEVRPASSESELSNAGSTADAERTAPMRLTGRISEEQLKALLRGAMPDPSFGADALAARQHNRLATLEVVQRLLAASELAGWDHEGSGWIRTTLDHCDAALAAAKRAAFPPVTGDSADQSEGDRILAAGHAASLIRQAVALFAEDSAAGRAELARLSDAAFSLSIAGKRRLLVREIELRILSLFHVSPEERVEDWRLDGIDAAGRDPSKPAEPELLRTATTLGLALEWDIPEVAKLDPAVVGELLRRCDPSSSRAIGAAYVAAAICIHTGALGHAQEANESFEEAARRQAKHFRLAKNARTAEHAKVSAPPAAASARSLRLVRDRSVT